jgi:tetratricopeptide (TPR) repeat protein
MRSQRFLVFAVAAAVLILASNIAAMAQSGELHGHVVLKQADGKTVPVEGAIIDVFRTDITSKMPSNKTNKRGEYVYAGIPFVGDYIVAASAPNAQPTFITGVKAGRDTDYELTMSPGDGRRLTLDEIKADAKKSGTPTSGGSSGKESAETKAKREEMAKKAAEVNARNEKVKEANEILNRSFKAGNEAFKAKNYDEAIKQYDEGIAADPEQAVLYQNKSIALRTRGVDKYNAGIKSNDQAAKDAGKSDIKAACETSEKAISLYRAQASLPISGGGGAPVPRTDPLPGALWERGESYRIAITVNAGADLDAALKAFQESAAAETDPAKKAKAEALVGEAQFQSGKTDEAVATLRQVVGANPNNVDALYWLGLALSTDKPQEALDTLKKFVAKAPDNDPRKKEASEAVQALEETLKPATTTTKPARRRG